MPIALRPGRRAFKVYLDSDTRGPDTDPPAFFCRVLTCDQFLEIGDEIAAAEKNKDGFAAVRAVFSGLRTLLTGWERMRTTDADLAKLFGVELPSDDGLVELPFRVDLAEHILTLDEAKELLQSALSGGMGEAEKKV